MHFSCVYYDGEWAEKRAVSARLVGSEEGGSWEIVEAGSNDVLARWPAGALVRKHARPGQVRLSAMSAPLGARLVLSGSVAEEALGAMPALRRRTRAERNQQALLLVASTLLLAGVIALYVWGVPLAAGPITAAMPPEWEADLGRSVAGQFEEAFGEDGRLAPCDPDPESPANRAIAGFVERVLGDRTPPFAVRVMVGRSEIPNAFAIPGGQIYYLSALLDMTESGEEFAGVLAHEMGHVMYRHAMQNIVSAAGTGLVIGFVLGDMTGVSLAAIIGSVLIDSHYSREAEREADFFAAEAAKRLGFAPNALPDLLDRIAGDDETDAAVLALLSSHPLTLERRHYLDQLAADAGSTGPAFSIEEWQAIRSMCDGGSGRFGKLTGRG
ncbi:MAG: M48 family metallopeptidase [Alphaproteobacteria bacterium]|nr:M48 family metallopeptidase [Alphaproteobacteria bacterium]